MIATVEINRALFLGKLYIRADADSLRVVGARWLWDEKSPPLPKFEMEMVNVERELREAFSNALADDDAGLYFWVQASYRAFMFVKEFEPHCLAYIDGANPNDPKSGFFIHEGVVYLSDESGPLAARIAADEQRELSALIGSNGVGRKGGRL